MCLFCIKQGRNVLKRTKMRLKHYCMQLLNIQEYKNVDFQILPNLLCVKHLQYESLISHQERNDVTQAHILVL